MTKKREISYYYFNSNRVSTILTYLVKIPYQVSFIFVIILLE